MATKEERRWEELGDGDGHMYTMCKIANENLLWGTKNSMLCGDLKKRGYMYMRASPGGAVVKNLPAMQETQEAWVRSLGWEDPLEKEMATHPSLLAWRSP